MIKNPKVRFAPSPTGELHVGNARTALFNWIFARHYGGTLILRIENTDQERSFKQFEEEIFEQLRWLSIDWDEGPYYQIDRLNIYQQYFQKLLEDGKVYPCYCTDEELDAERKMLIADGKMPRYMGKCRNLSSEQKKKLEEEGRKPAYRFKVEKGIVEFDDLIRGTMHFECEAMGDFIIVRSTGVPAYNFAVVIDDHLMKISHVIRGEDHLSNTALQIMLYKALKFEIPVFAHHSLILGKDRTKLSKRHGAVSVKEFRRRGILPEALLNYLSLLGSSAENGKEIMTAEEIIRNFSIERIGKSGAIFDEAKLRWLNRIYIRNLDIEVLAELLLPHIKKAGYDICSFEKEWLYKVVEVVQGNMNTLSDIGNYIDIFFDEYYAISEEAKALLEETSSIAIVKSLCHALETSEYNNLYTDVLNAVKEETKTKGKRLFMPVRAAITGKIWGPELDKVFAILGKESLLKRAKKAFCFIDEKNSGIE